MPELSNRGLAFSYSLGSTLLAVELSLFHGAVIMCCSTQLRQEPLVMDRYVTHLHWQRLKRGTRITVSTPLRQFPGDVTPERCPRIFPQPCNRPFRFARLQ